MAAGVRLIFSGLPRYQEAHYRAFAGHKDRALFTDTLDDALQSLEAELLSTRPESAPDTASLLLNDLLALLFAESEFLKRFIEARAGVG